MLAAVQSRRTARRPHPGQAALTSPGASSLVSSSPGSPGAPGSPGSPGSLGSPAPPAPGAPRATTLFDLAPLPTQNREAAAEYSAGIQSLHDDSWGQAQHHFERTVLLDPTLALAHLRLAMVLQDSQDPRRRDEWEKASALRAQLGERDAVLLEAVEPVLQRTRDDTAEAYARFERASRRYPGDVEILDWLGILGSEPAAMLSLAERAIALDPNDGQAMQNKATALRMLGKSDEALAAFEQCASVALASTDCLMNKVRLEQAEGRCELAESDARRLVDRDPRAAELLVASMVALHRPEGAISEAIAQLESHELEPARRLDVLRHRATVAALSGDLALAERVQRELALAVAAEPATRADYGWRYRTALGLVVLLREEGKDDAAREAAGDFLTRSEAWTQTRTRAGAVDEGPWLDRLVAGKDAGATDDFERRRAAWVDEALHGAHAYAGLVWPYAYAEPALTEDEARAALSALPKFEPLAFAMRDDVPEAHAGHAFLLAGRAEQALPYLRRAVAHCGTWYFPAKQMRAAFELGQALEQSEHRPEACAAYGKVLERWGRARPRSVTADAARARARALGCAI